jgi:hypothetical protein
MLGKGSIRKGTETLDRAHGKPSVGSGLPSEGGSSMLFALFYLLLRRLVVLSRDRLP